MSVIDPDLMSPLNSSGLPLGIERAILHTPIYLTLQPLSSTASYITIRTGKLLPYLLTLTASPQTPPHKRGANFPLVGGLRGVAVIFFYLTLLSRTAIR